MGEFHIRFIKKNTKIETVVFPPVQTARSTLSSQRERSDWKRIHVAEKTKIVKIHVRFSVFRKVSSSMRFVSKSGLPTPSDGWDIFPQSSKRILAVLAIIFSQFWTRTKFSGRAPRIFFWEFEFLVFFSSKVCVGAYRKKLFQHDSRQFWCRKMPA